MSVIQVLHGNQTFKNASTKVNVFVMRADGTDKRDFPNKVIQQVKGAYNAAPAALDGYKDHGMWYNTRYESQDGIVLMVMVSSTYHGNPYANGCLMLHLREDAPLIKVDVNTTYNANAVHTNIPAFQGKADILTLDELEGYGIVLNRNFKNNYFDEEEVEEVFSVNTLSQGSKRPELLTVKTPEGNVRKVPVVKENGRRIRIRRKT